MASAPWWPEVVRRARGRRVGAAAVWNVVVESVAQISPANLLRALRAIEPTDASLPSLLSVAWPVRRHGMWWRAVCSLCRSVRLVETELRDHRQTSPYVVHARTRRLVDSASTRAHRRTVWTTT